MRKEATLSTDEPLQFLRLIAGAIPKRSPLFDEVRNPVQHGHRFQRKADSNPVIADSR